MNEVPLAHAIVGGLIMWSRPVGVPVRNVSPIQTRMIVLVRACLHRYHGDDVDHRPAPLPTRYTIANSSVASWHSLAQVDCSAVIEPGDTRSVAVGGRPGLAEARQSQ